MTDEHRPSEQVHDLPPTCPIRWLATDVGGFLTDGEAAPAGRR